MSSTDSSETVEETSIAELTSKYFAPSPVPVDVQFGALSHPGKVRPNNEDHYLVVRRQRSREVLLSNLPDGFLPQNREESYAMIVADGMGGAAFGELASMLAIRAGWDLATTEIKWPLKINEVEAQEVLEKLDLYGQLIHRSLRERTAAEPWLRGMGTTITIGYTVGLDAFVGHVGDSRAYLFRNGTLHQLTSDHTLAQKMLEAGVITSLEAASRRMQHMLLNCLGGSSKDVQVETHHIPLADGDLLLLCTDGLTDMLDAGQIAQALDRKTHPDTICQELVNLALDAGGRDNVTVVVARFSTIKRA